VAQGLDEFLKLVTAAWEGEEMAYIVAKIEPFKKIPGIGRIANPPTVLRISITSCATLKSLKAL
jgi:hypothetical protein